MTKGPFQSIAIIGGGIGGLATAGFLRESGLDVHVFEQAAALTEVGAGLIVTPNCARLVRALGQFSLLRDRGVTMSRGWQFRRWEDGSVLFSQELDTQAREEFGEEMFSAHRSDLLEACKQSVPPDWVHLDHQMVSATETNRGVDLQFANGLNVDADAVIGADGVHSMIRKELFGQNEPVYAGIQAFRAVIPADGVPDFAALPEHNLWIGPNHHLVHYPIQAGRSVNLVAFAPAGDYDRSSWTATGKREELIAEFAGWDSRLLNLLAAVDTPGRWALLDLDPLETWVSGGGRVTLLGDAAHPMYPFYAQGAAQAMEDAAVLGRVLTDGEQQPFARYEATRKRRATELQSLSRQRKHVNHLPDGPEQVTRDRALAHQNPLEGSRWIYDYDALTIAIESPPR